jgi:GPH family glycoside/pentoside/hexuronide:cation symporter
MSENSNEHLPKSVVAGYAAPAMMLAAMGATFYIYLPKFYVDQLGIGLGTLSAIILVARLWDAITDPAIGWLSDRTQSRWGRRRPWILVASIPLAATFLVLGNPLVIGASGLGLAVTAFLFFLAWTALTIPYEALGPEISSGYDERNKLFGAREAMVFVGTVAAAALPAWLVPGSFGWPGYTAVGLIFGVVLVASALICAKLVPEKQLSRERQPHGSPWKASYIVFSNRPFRIILLAYTVYSFGAALGSTVFLFFAEQVLRSTNGPYFMVIYLATGVIFLPGWIFIARKLEKRTTWIVALSMSCAAFAGAGFLNAGDELIFGILMVLTGISLGGIFAIPPSMQADAIDYDESNTGVREEGQYVGMWALGKKLAMAFGAGIALLLLGKSGYVAGADLQPETASLTLRWLFVGIPCCCNVIAIALVLRYPISRNVHR